ncbi:MAG: hypothetical protein ACI9MC_002002 [Kiritimatiellia bacterium]|jgi:hypothetical protein
MATPLHEHSALADIGSSFDGAAQHWARCQLAVWSPDAFERFPIGENSSQIALAAAPDGVERTLLNALEVSDAPTEALARSVAMAPRWGLELDRERTIAACRRALSDRGAAADPWLAHAIALRSALTADDLRAAAATRSPAAAWLVPSLAVRFAGAQADAVAEQVAQGLQTAAQQHAFLQALGSCADLSPGRMDPDDAVRWGAGRAGGLPTTRTPARGSRKHRARGWVVALLETDASPLAAGLRAIARTPQHPKLGTQAVAQAAWSAAYEPLEPVIDVIARYAGQHPTTLRQALRSVSAAELPSIQRAIAHGNHGAAVLGLAVDRGQVAQAVLDRAIAQPEEVWLCTAAALAPHLKDRVPGLISDGSTRLVGLALASMTPTFEVLEVLLQLNVPADTHERRAYVWALASMGDPVASNTVHALAEHDDRHGSAVALCVSLGHR